MVKEEIKKIIEAGHTSLGIEFGSTRIKAVLVDDQNKVLAQGSCQWENRFENQIWTYSIKDIHEGMQACYRDLKENIRQKYGVTLKKIGAMGISAMMHGYMVFDDDKNILVPFRTWRNTMTEKAAAILAEKFNHPIPQRWSIAHLYQAILNEESHLPQIKYMTTLDGYIHWMLTGEKVIGVGHASGMFPVNDATRDFDAQMLDIFDELIKDSNLPWKIRDIMPRVLNAGENAGYLTEEGAVFLDPEGDLEARIPMCPSEGDAGTGMVATNSVKKGTGNVSAGTSVFAMIVLERPLSKVYAELDMVTTPDGEPVAMVHCNNCTSELNSWMGLFKEVLQEMSVQSDDGELFTKMFNKALEGDADGGSLIAYPYLSGEHIPGIESGCVMFMRSPESRFNLANFMRTQLYASISTLRMGMDFLVENENMTIEHLVGHGGFFKTPVVGQQIMADMLGIPVVVMENAGEGGAWGMALLASYMRNGHGKTLPEFLSNHVFGDTENPKLLPSEEGKAGANKFINNYKLALDIEKAASAFLS